MGDDTADAGETLGAEQFDLDAAPAAAAAGARVGTAEGAQDQKKNGCSCRRKFSSKNKRPQLSTKVVLRGSFGTCFGAGKGPPQFWAPRKLNFRAKTNAPNSRQKWS